MTQTFDFYSARASEATAEADAATLDNVRERNLRAAKTWKALADQAKRVMMDREKAARARERRHAKEQAELEEAPDEPRAGLGLTNPAGLTPAPGLHGADGG